jgi:hypothetical protein
LPSRPANWPSPLANNTGMMPSTAGQQYWPAMLASTTRQQ